MKLYEIPKMSKIKVTTQRGEEIITFHHLDGMYSYCETSDGKNIHLAATTPLKLNGDVYEIDDTAYQGAIKNSVGSQGESI